MSVVSFIGPKPNLLGIDEREPAAASRGEPAGARLRPDGEDPPHREVHRRQVRELSSSTSPTRSRGASEAIEARLASLCAQAEDAVRSGYSIIDPLRPQAGSRSRSRSRRCSRCRPCTSIWCGKGLRTSTGLVVETGSAREAHHFALLGGYGAEAVHPYLAFETLLDLQGLLPSEVDGKKAVKNYIKAIGKGLKKVMSKMGVSTYMSYTGAQIFEAVGLRKGVRRQVLHRHRVATSRASACSRWPRKRSASTALAFDEPTRCSSARSTPAASTPGACAARSTCGRRTRSPSSSTRRAPTSYSTYKEYAQIINDQSRAAHDVARAVRVQVRPGEAASRSRRSSRPRRS